MERLSRELGMAAISTTSTDRPNRDSNADLKSKYCRSSVMPRGLPNSTVTSRSLLAKSKSERRAEHVQLTNLELPTQGRQGTAMRLHQRQAVHGTRWCFLPFQWSRDTHGIALCCRGAAPPRLPFAQRLAHDLAARGIVATRDGLLHQRKQFGGKGDADFFYGGHFDRVGSNK